MFFGTQQQFEFVFPGRELEWILCQTLNMAMGIKDF